VLTNVGSLYDEANAVELLPDGKIVVGGATWSSGSDSSWVLARYSKRGRLDPTFGVGGQVTTALAPFDDELTDLVLQPDGKVVAVGYKFEGQESTFALARYNSDGSLDTTFGSGGKVEGLLGGAGAAARQPDGKLLAAGTSKYDFALVRYGPSGSLDAGFGTGGAVRTDLGGVDIGYTMAVQRDGRIVVAGVSFDGTNVSWAIVRYQQDGALDTSFGTGGKVLTSFGSLAFVNAIQPLPSGKILLAGYVGHGNPAQPTFALARYTSDGSLDPTFGNGGTVATDFGTGSVIRSVRLQLNGKLVAAGVTSQGTPAVNRFALARYKPNGSLDPSFGVGGKITTKVGGTSASAFDLAIQPDGRMVVVGSSAIAGEDWSLALTRYLGDTCVVPNVRGRSLAAARKRVRKAACSVGRVARRFSGKVEKGHVIAERPAPKSRVAAATKVELTVSKGRRR
jgi:uncharacterized delta-60 repeat protein